MRTRYIRRKSANNINTLKKIFPQPIGMNNTGINIDQVKLVDPMKIKPDTSLINQKIKYDIPMRWDALFEMIPDGIELIGAEIGVLHGETAMRLLQHRQLIKHVMIDPWVVPEAGSSYALSGDNNSKKPQACHDTAYHLTRTRVAFAKDRAIIMRTTSEEAVKQFDDGYFDYVFIDGDHSYLGVKNDIHMWFPKIKKGGWIGGHDYGNQRLPGVKRAVDEFFNKCEIILSHEDTWFVRISSDN